MAPPVSRAFDKYLSDAATRGQPLVLSISSKIQQALEQSSGDAKAQFSAIGAADGHGRPHGRSPRTTSLPAMSPNAPGQGTPVQNAATRWASSSPAQRSSRSRLRWPWTLASSGAPARSTTAPKKTVSATCVHDTHPLVPAHARSPRLMMESSNIGMAQIADQLGTTRQKVCKMGFLRPRRNRAQGTGRARRPGLFSRR